MFGSLDHWLARQVLRVVGDPPVGLELDNGARVRPGNFDAKAGVTIQLRDRKALYRLLCKPTRSFGDLYTSGRLDVDCDMVEVLERIYPSLARIDRSSGQLKRLVRRFFKARPRANSLRGSRQNIHDHYDLGNDFYELWLDRDYMQYTCAYYPTEAATLEAAQVAKMDLVCRKLALQPGETIVEAGSGWGGFARYMARNYGVRVRSYNISAEQVAYARQRAQADGLDDAIEYIEDDYRNISGTYDVFVSIGMLEHVGVDNYHRLGATIDRSLKDKGRGLIHTIGQNRPRPLNEWIEQNIFPGAYPPTLQQMMAIFEPFAFSVVDVENLRMHYAWTLRDWRERFNQNRDKVLAMFDERFARAWNLYLSGSMSAFTVGQLQLFQVLFQRGGSNALPVTRERIFTGG
jgi:cyclopropane-fatty-acyl-phospholipid synthase